jgi:hypothetical protein
VTIVFSEVKPGLLLQRHLLLPILLQQVQKASGISLLLNAFAATEGLQGTGQIRPTESVYN